MLCENVKLMIQSYTDDELEKGKEAFIFTHLAECEECREYFKKSSGLTAAVQNDIKEFPQLLERRILTSLTEQKNVKQNVFFSNVVQKALPYIITVIFLSVSLYFFGQTSAYRDKLDEAVEEIKTQKIKIELLYNSLPQAVVEGNLENKVVIHANM